MEQRWISVISRLRRDIAATCGLRFVGLRAPGCAQRCGLSEHASTSTGNTGTFPLTIIARGSLPQSDGTNSLCPRLLPFFLVVEIGGANVCGQTCSGEAPDVPTVVPTPEGDEEAAPGPEGPEAASRQGGGGGIRTHKPVRAPHFECGALPFCHPSIRYSNLFPPLTSLKTPSFTALSS